jgi:hypothetical protein
MVAMGLTRRALLSLAAATPVLSIPDGWAQQGTGNAIPAMALALHVAQVDGAAVASDGLLDAWLSEAERLMSPHGVSVVQVERLALRAERARIENALERDALAAELHPKVINAFIVQRLRDIDDPERFIQGVRWRNRKNLSKDYVIVSAKASPTTLTHELGHFLGNGHSRVVNNIMSYERDDPAKIEFNKAQGAKLRLVAKRLLAAKKVLSAEDYEQQRG